MLIVAAIVLAFGIFMYKMGAEVFEESRMFGIGVAIFFFLFISATLLFTLFGPRPEGSSDVLGLVTAAMGVTPE